MLNNLFDHCRQTGSNISIFVVNGFKMTGKVNGYDDTYVVIQTTEGDIYYVRLTSISTVVAPKGYRL